MCLPALWYFQREIQLLNICPRLLPSLPPLICCVQIFKSKFVFQFLTKKSFNAGLGLERKRKEKSFISHTVNSLPIFFCVSEKDKSPFSLCPRIFQIHRSLSCPSHNFFSDFCFSVHFTMFTVHVCFSQRDNDFVFFFNSVQTVICARRKGRNSPD